ncbi:unnamed protein product [Dibothriocephalus latus]|uniref:F-BAR domain-containing protein n=1 Tax=Dibothriocephalus latus TaxID=60516 RepID=A0A3P6PL45_DIBLA|nr:unnamed protein product [Dibothriocephalus latus]
MQKAKDLYHTRYTEYERIRLNETHSAKEKEKAEGKLKKAQDDYKYSVEKYNNLRTQFVEKMRVSCAHFQVSKVACFVKICPSCALKFAISQRGSLRRSTTWSV